MPERNYGRGIKKVMEVIVGLLKDRIEVDDSLAKWSAIISIDIMYWMAIGQWSPYPLYLFL